jgi:hypothetical protein
MIFRRKTGSPAEGAVVFLWSHYTWAAFKSSIAISCV